MEQKKLSEEELKGIKGVESESVDLDKFHKKGIDIESVEVIQTNSNFTPLIDGTTEHQKQWVLRVASKVVESIGEGETKIDFRASELFNLLQDDMGNLVGFPKGEKSNLMGFLKDMRIDQAKVTNLYELIEAIKGKTATIKAYTKEVTTDGKTNTRTYLKFLY